VSQVVSRLPVKQEVWVLSQAIPRGVYGRQSVVGILVSSSTLVFPTIIPPTLHSRISFIWHQRYTILANDSFVNRTLPLSLSLSLCTALSPRGQSCLMKITAIICRIYMMYSLVSRTILNGLLLNITLHLRKERSDSQCTCTNRN